MAVNLSPVGGVAAQFFTNSGTPLTGGKIFTYAAGTTTPQAAYTTSQGNIAWTNPIVLDAAGRVPNGGEIWITDGLIYKFVLKDANDVLIATYDNITGINSNAVAYTNQQEIVTATAGQTVFNLGINYQPGTNSLSVFVDGVNQYGPGAQYSYVETDQNTVTFNAGLHAGAEVKFTSTQQQGAGVADAEQVSYQPPFTGSVATNVEAKLAQTVSIKDFGAVGDGITDDAPALRAAMAALDAIGGGSLKIPQGTYLLASRSGVSVNGIECIVEIANNVSVIGDGYQSVLKAANGLLSSAPTLWFAKAITTNYEKIVLRDLCFDFNGANNLYPASGYYPSTALQLQNSGVGAVYIDYVMVDGCLFLDNPGNNSISVVDANVGVTTTEYARKVIITNNHFHNFGYTVANGANSNNNDHSALYIQAQEVVITNNTFSNDYFDPSSNNVAAAFDHHAAYCVFSNNVAMNNTYVIAHQNSGVGTIRCVISNNTALCASFYKLFAGAGGAVANIQFTDNVIGVIASSGFPAPTFDMYTAVSNDPLDAGSFNFTFDGNEVTNASGTFAGLSIPTIKVKRSDNMIIQNNSFWNACGQAIYMLPVARLNRVYIKSNTIAYWGIGDVASTKYAIELDTTATDPNYYTTAIVEDNIFDRAGNPVAPDAGVRFSGKYADLRIVRNQYVGVTTNYSTPGIDATVSLVEGNSQVAFFASENLSALPNVLDDYQEGTWTPTVTNVTDCSVTPKVSRYTKIGNLVTVNVRAEVSGAGSGSPRFDFSLPFAPVSEYGFSGLGAGFPYTLRWQVAPTTSPNCRCDALNTSATLHDFNVCLSYQTAS